MKEFSLNIKNGWKKKLRGCNVLKINLNISSHKFNGLDKFYKHTLDNQNHDI